MQKPEFNLHIACLILFVIFNHLHLLASCLIHCLRIFSGVRYSFITRKVSGSVNIVGGEKCREERGFRLLD